MVKQEAITLSVAIQFAWHKLLHVYTRDRQTIVGTTISGRTIPISGIEGVGLYINTLPLVIDWEETQSIRNQLQSIHHQITEMNHHSTVNLVSLQKEGRRLFHSLLIFENYPLPEGKEKLKTL